MRSNFSRQQFLILSCDSTIASNSIRGRKRPHLLQDIGLLEVVPLHLPADKLVPFRMDAHQRIVTQFQVQLQEPREPPELWRYRARELVAGEREHLKACQAAESRRYRQGRSLRIWGLRTRGLELDIPKNSDNIAIIIICIHFANKLDTSKTDLCYTY